LKTITSQLKVNSIGICIASTVLSFPAVQGRQRGDAGGPLLKTVVDAGVPVLVFFAMLIVGTELTTDDLSGRRPGFAIHSGR
jgi:hypothetical protein